jgi:ubiquitin-like domain-containing CTD phosphatase 1
MKWIKAKMEELGVMQNTNYKLSFMLDSLAMITVATAEYGVIDVCSNDWF